MKPNYTDLGFADKMGPNLRMLVEKQLREDLGIYEIKANKYNLIGPKAVQRVMMQIIYMAQQKTSRELKYLMKKMNTLQMAGWSLFSNQPTPFLYVTGIFSRTFMAGKKLL